MAERFTVAMQAMAHQSNKRAFVAGDGAPAVKGGASGAADSICDAETINQNGAQSADGGGPRMGVRSERGESV